MEKSVKADWEKVARLTIPELLVRVRKQTGRSARSIDRAALVSLITGTDRLEVTRRVAELQRTTARPRTARARGFVDAMRDRVRIRRGRARARR